MTRLVFAVTSSAYLLIAIPFEERSIGAVAASYADYVRRVRWRLVPFVYCAALAIGCGSDPPAVPTAPTPTAPLPGGNACGALGLGPTAILSGTDCTPGTSSVVSLNSRAADGANAGSCSGTIIAPRRILTAAHCLEETAVVRVWLGVGDQIETRTFVPHPQYSGAAGRAEDVAIVTMDQDLPRPPIPLLLGRDARVGESAVIAGWGRDLNNVTATLRAGLTTITAVTPSAIQTIFASNVSSICSGDSGGPILVLEGGVWAVAGVISATTEAACNTGTNFYANLRNSSTSSFILAQAPEASRR